MKISLEVREDQVQLLSEVARRLNVSAEELASAALRDLLAQGEDEFRRAAERVLQKNRELYQRLS